MRACPLPPTDPPTCFPLARRTLAVARLEHGVLVSNPADVNETNTLYNTAADERGVSYRSDPAPHAPDEARTTYGTAAT